MTMYEDLKKILEVIGDMEAEHHKLRIALLATKGELSMEIEELKERVQKLEKGKES